MVSSGRDPQQKPMVNGAGSHAPEEDDEAADAAAVDATPAPDDEVLEGPPPAVAELCAACMRFVASKYKVALDGTPDTLSLLDQYVRDARAAVEERPDSVHLVAPAIGAYIGEVVRHAFGGVWFVTGTHDAYRLYFTHVYLAVNPLGIGREALTMQDEDGWHAHLSLDPGEREMIEQRLAAMPEVDAEEYYLPSTRFDVIHAVVETLRAHAEGNGTSDVRFAPEDYDES